MPENLQQRMDLLYIFRHAVQAVNGKSCVHDWLTRNPPATEVFVIAIGKAASAMTAGAIGALGDAVRQVLLITKAGHAEPVGRGGPPVRVLESAHPVPDERSLQAGAALLDFIHSVPRGGQLLFLISGGTSSLIEVLPHGIRLSELQRGAEWLLGSGLDIARVNHLRKQLSAIKGGRLALRLGGRPALVLMISDVPGDDPATIGSGLFTPHRPPTGVDTLQVPAWLQSLFACAPVLPDADHPAFVTVNTVVIAGPGDARHAACEYATELGYRSWRHDEFIGGPAEPAGCNLAEQIAAGPQGVHVWSGETTVRLPEQPGRGGRCQHLALAAAQLLHGTGKLLLAAGSDGGDGPGTDAGAVVDGGTLARGVDAGLDARQSLDRADAGLFLEASGDLIQTGPTGTNVMDLLIGLQAD